MNAWNELYLQLIDKLIEIIPERLNATHLKK